MALFAPSVHHLSQDSLTGTSVIQHWEPNVVGKTNPAEPEPAAEMPVQGCSAGNSSPLPHTKVRIHGTKLGETGLVQSSLFFCQQYRHIQRGFILLLLDTL